MVFCCGEPSLDDPVCLADAVLLRLVEVTDLNKSQVIPEEATEESLPRLQVRDQGERGSDRYPDFRAATRRMRCRYFGRNKAESYKAVRDMLTIEKDAWIVSQEGCACPVSVIRGAHYRRFNVWIGEVILTLTDFSP